jgi:hypothetical protein
MKRLRNSIITTIPVLSIAILFVVPLSYAQQLNQVKAYIAPTEAQPSYFPSEQQIQQALVPKTASSIAQKSTSFPPIVRQPPTFINQFSTPDAPRLTPNLQFVAPDTMTNRVITQQKYIQPNKRYDPRTRLNTPAVLPAIYADKSNLPQQVFPKKPMGNRFSSNSSSLNNSPFSFPTLPFGNNSDVHSIPDWKNTMGNKFPSTPKINTSNRKKTGGNKRTVLPYFDTDNAENEVTSGARNLGGMSSDWRFPYISTPTTITNQFPPITAEAENSVDFSKWGVFDGK